MLISVSGTQGSNAHGATGVEDTLKDFWATRPRRPRRGRKIAGVAAGIGNRYGIDPVVVRVAFVVATFYGGVGVLFYLLGWLLLPEQDDEAAPFESMINHRRSSTSSGFTVLLCLALVPACWFLFDNQFSGFFGLIIVMLVLYLLHRTRGHIGRPSMPAPPAESTDFGTVFTPTTPPMPPTAAPTLGSPAAHQTTATYADAPPAEPAPTTPPAWDPLGAAPFAWDLPEPSPPAAEPPAPRKRSKAGLITVGAALVVGGGLALAYPYAGGWLTPAHIIGILLGVLGLGMVGGSFVRGGRGLIGLAVPLAAVGILLTAVSPDGWHGAGEITERPTTVDQVRPNYQRSLGAVDLDLRALPNTGTVDTRVNVGAGDIVIVVPPKADVEVRCHANLGNVECLGHTAAGADTDVSVTDNGVDGPGGLKIKLDVEVGTGNAEVRRG
jgi:phage shock protein PspC (stress-responsive transcriptional regulator)